MKKITVIVLLALCIIVSGCTNDTGSNTSNANSINDSGVLTHGEKNNPAVARDLYAGVYTVGEDLAAGTYDFHYIATVSEDNYEDSIIFGGDAMVLLKSGSQSTLGYDNIYGGWPYESASTGVDVHLTLHKGDRLTLTAKYGKWTY